MLVGFLAGVEPAIVAASGAAVLLITPWAPHVPNRGTARLALAMASTLAGKR